jgi:histidinol dehydrogenase
MKLAMSDSVAIRRLNSSDDSFAEELSTLLAWESVSDSSVAKVVSEILQQVSLHGDSAVLDYTRQFDRSAAATISELIVSQERMQQALKDISAEQRDALETAAQRIQTYHKHQIQDSWQFQEESGTVLGQQITPMEKVGLYVPGGKASYPSSVLMNAIPAKVAGVDEIIMVVPAPDGVLSDMVLAAAAIAEVDMVITIGGAQAVAALAYGTESVPKVDKIVGPGNIYVATAKRSVFGLVDIDMIAGPSEILIVCDGMTDPDWIAMDLFSQAEHDEQAQSILITDNADFIEKVQSSIDRLLPTLDRSTIAQQSLCDRGALILVSDLEEAIELVNRIAPEHLELSVDQPEAFLPKIRHAGAIFMGRYTAEALGDYCAGPNHVLPTSGTARFSSPLGVYDFQKRSSIVSFSEQGASDMGKVASILARSESLEAHARSAEYRIKPE